MTRFFSLLLTLVLVVPLALAQSKPAGNGHWEGTLQLPDRDLKMVLDLTQNAKAEWVGTLGIPEMGANDVPLTALAVKANTVSFKVDGPPGDPTFHGTVSEDGKELKGNLEQSGGTFAFSLKWVSAPSVKEPARSTPITKEFEGNWEGTITPPNGTNLRINIKLANGPNGATGTLISINQMGQEFPFTTITQKESKIEMELRILGAVFKGELKAGEIAGEWSQGGATLPLVLKRPAEKK